MHIDDSEEAPFGVELKHDSVDAGGLAAVRGRLAVRVLADPSPVEVVVFDAAGAEIGRARFIDQEDGWHRTAHVMVRVPAAEGSHGFSASLRDFIAPPAEGEEAEEAETYASVPFAVATRGHATQIVVWDVPPAIEAGQPVQFRVGLRCSCGCASAGWGFTVEDQAGAVLAEGTAGDQPWQGTAGLCHAAVSLPAQAEPGRMALTVRARGPAGGIGHAPAAETVQLRITEPARHAVRVRAVDAGSGRPLAKAKVVAHPFRTLADAEGRAELRLPPGRYTLFVSGDRHFAWQQPLDLEGDVDLVAELEIDREFTPEEMWS